MQTFSPARATRYAAVLRCFRRLLAQWESVYS